MPRALALLMLLAVVVCGAVAAVPASACACGIALDADVTSERALVIQRAPGREEIVAGFDLSVDPGGTAAVVLPVPGDPTVKAVEGDPLGYLDQATAPPIGSSGGSDGSAAGAAPGGGVDLIGRETVGGYDVSRLRAGDPKALGRWLDEHGYTLPAGAQPILAQYVKRGWRYVAIRLAKGQQGRLKPLRVAFRSPGLVYPMRLSRLAKGPVSLTVYVLAPRKQQTRLLASSYDGPLAKLSPAPPAELDALFPPGSYLTKFTGASIPADEFTRDLVITPAAVVAQAAGDDDDGGLPWWAYAIAAFVVVDAVVMFAVLRRVRARRAGGDAP